MVIDEVTFQFQNYYDYGHCDEIGNVNRNESNKDSMKTIGTAISVTESIMPVL
jgi:hypothetical protein